MPTCGSVEEPRKGPFLLLPQLLQWSQGKQEEGGQGTKLTLHSPESKSGLPP